MNQSQENLKMDNSSSEFKNFTRGGQITLHNIRMYFQIIDKVLWITGALFILFLIASFWILTTEYQRYVSLSFLQAAISTALNPDAKTIFTLPTGSSISIPCKVIFHSALIKQIVRDCYHRLIISVIFSLFSFIAAFVGISAWLKKRGKKHTDDIQLKGDQLIDKNILKDELIKLNKASDLVLAGLPLVKNKETAHFFFHGTTGTGKSTAIKELLDQIRKRGDRAIVYDMSCNYLEEFFDSSKDILLNPMDERGQSWHLWKECRDAADFDSLAAAQIPMPVSTQDPFWVNAARTIFSSAAYEMRNDPSRNIIKLLRYLLTSDLEKMESYLKGTEAETLASRKTEKTAISIKSVLATYLKSMKYIKDEANPFSIREWIKNEEENNWLFISSIEDRHETLKPLITAWLDIAVNALMSLPPSQNRRIWLILDELTSLHRLPYLGKTLAKARKFGGCIVVGIQNFADLEEEYGNKGARSISSLLNTRFFFREPDPDMAVWSAKNFGETIVEEVREGISYGANTMRDGITVNRVETCKPLINFSQIMNLNDLNCYVRLPGDFPITLVDFIYKKRETKNIGIEQRFIDHSPLKDVEELIDKYDQSNDVDDEVKPKARKKKNPKLSDSRLEQALDI